MLQVLARLKDLPDKLTPIHVSDLMKAAEDGLSAQRMLYGNVLIAEGIYLYHCCGNSIQLYHFR